MTDQLSKPLRLDEHVVVNLQDEVGFRTKGLEPAERRQRLQRQVLEQGQVLISG